MAATRSDRFRWFAGGFAWNERDMPGGPATAALDAYPERLLQIWMTPHGAVELARAGDGVG